MLLAMNRDHRAWLAKGMCALVATLSQGIEAIDLLPVFRKTDELDLYATDFHIWKRGHATLAEALLPRLVDLLAN